MKTKNLKDLRNRSGIVSFPAGPWIVRLGRGQFFGPAGDYQLGDVTLVLERGTARFKDVCLIIGDRQPLEFFIGHLDPRERKLYWWPKTRADNYIFRFASDLLPEHAHYLERALKQRERG